MAFLGARAHQEASNREFYHKEKEEHTQGTKAKTIPGNWMIRGNRQAELMKENSSFHGMHPEVPQRAWKHATVKE